MFVDGNCVAGKDMHSSFYTKGEWKQIDDFGNFVFKSLIPKYYLKNQNVIGYLQMLNFEIFLIMCLLELENKNLYH